MNKLLLSYVRFKNRDKNTLYNNNLFSNKNCMIIALQIIQLLIKQSIY